MNLSWPRTLCLLVCAAVFAGCAGSGEGLDASGRPIGEDPGGPLTASFGSIQAHVFTPICTACHAGANAPQGLRLDADNSYNLLVGVPSTEVPSILRVNPGNPDNSYLIQKLEGTAAVGARMPLDLPPLPNETIAVIRQWITDGAAAEAPTASAAEFKLTMAVPANGDVVGDALKRIVLGFSRELDATRADAASIRLERFEPGAAEASATPMPIVVSMPTANPKALMLSLEQPLPAGSYRVVVDGHAGGISDLSGNRLSGADASGEQVISVFAVEESQ